MTSRSTSTFSPLHLPWTQRGRPAWCRGEGLSTGRSKSDQLPLCLPAAPKRRAATIA